MEVYHWYTMLTLYDYSGFALQVRTNPRSVAGIFNRLCARGPGVYAGDRRLPSMLELLQIVVHTMRHEYRTTRLQISVHPGCGTGEHPGSHVRLRPICVQLGLATAYRCVLRTPRTNRLCRNLQAAHGVEAGTRQTLAIGMQQRSVAAISQQPRHGIQELLSGTGALSDLQEAGQQAIGSLYDFGVSLEERSNLASKNGSAARYSLESDVRRNPVQCHHQQGYGGTVFCFYFSGRINQSIAGQLPNGGYRLRIEGCGNFEQRDKSPQPHLSAQGRTEVSPCSKEIISQAERLKESRQGQNPGGADQCKDCGSAPRLATQAHYATRSRKPSDQRGESQDQEHGQESLSSQIHFGCGLGRDGSPTGLQSRLVWENLCSDRSVVSQQQAVFSVRPYSRHAESGYPQLAMPGLWREPRPGYKRRNQHLIGRLCDCSRGRQDSVARNKYGGTRRILSLRSLSQPPMGQSQRSIGR